MPATVAPLDSQSRAGRASTQLGLPYALKDFTFVLVARRTP